MAAPAAPVNAPPPAGGGFFGYGVQAHMLGGGIDGAVNATANLGFNWIKQQVEWRNFEGSQGAIDFSELRRGGRCRWRDQRALQRGQRAGLGA
ncbi:MAG: hypothetical protein R2851_23480 [Caldilineaceae bacterium]